MVIKIKKNKTGYDEIELKNLINIIKDKLLIYPNSLDIGLLEYDIQKLHGKLRESEESLLLSNVKLQKEASDISNDYGDLAEIINSKSDNMVNIMTDMEKLDNRINDNLKGNYKVYATQWGLSVKALWYYRNDDFKESVRLTKQCVDLIDELIFKGMHSLVFRNIEQNKNLAFILKKNNKKKSSDYIKGDILNYYFSGKTKTLYGRCFNNNSIWNEMPYLRDSFGYLTFKENVEKYYDVCQISFSEGNYFYNATFSNILSCVPNTLERYIIFKWLETQDAFYDKKYIDFLIKMNDFFDEEKEVFFDAFKKILLLQFLSIVHLSKLSIDEKNKIEVLIFDFKDSKLSKYRVKDFNGGTRKAQIE
jgi:hypothetical protein